MTAENGGGKSAKSDGAQLCYEKLHSVSAHPLSQLLHYDNPPVYEQSDPVPSHRNTATTDSFFSFPYTKKVG